MFNLVNCLRNKDVRCQATADEVQGRIILEVAYYAGTYGMGGPGFFGMRLSASHNAPEEWLLCTLWGAGYSMTVDGRWLLTGPDQYAQKKPLYGVVYERTNRGSFETTGETWDEFQPHVIGQPVQRFLCDNQSCELVIGQTTLRIIGDRSKYHAFLGLKWLRHLTPQPDLRQAWVLAKTATIWTNDRSKPAVRRRT
jgi:hypothetical protein